jgi:hypothetical protein
MSKDFNKEMARLRNRSWLDKKLDKLIYLILDAPFTIKYWLKFWYQKWKYKTADAECWNLDVTLSKLILPKLIRFKEMQRWSLPPAFTRDGEFIPSEDPKADEGPNKHLSESEWEEVLDEIIFAFAYTIDVDAFGEFPVEGEMKIDKGFVHFEYKDPDAALKINNYHEKHRQLQERQKRGLRLFGLYFNHLWD